MFNKFLNSALKQVLFFLLKTLACSSLDFFMRIEVLAPEIFLLLGKQVEIARNEIWAVGWMW